MQPRHSRPLPRGCTAAAAAPPRAAGRASIAARPPPARALLARPQKRVGFVSPAPPARASPPCPASPRPPAQYADWVAEVLAVKEEVPLAYPHHDDVIMPQWAIEVRAGPLLLGCSHRGRREAALHGGGRALRVSWLPAAGRGCLPPSPAGAIPWSPLCRGDAMVTASSLCPARPRCSSSHDDPPPRNRCCTRSPRATPSSPPAWGSTRCGPRRCGAAAARGADEQQQRRAAAAAGGGAAGAAGLPPQPPALSSHTQSPHLNPPALHHPPTHPPTRPPTVLQAARAAAVGHQRRPGQHGLRPALRAGRRRRV